MVGTYQQATEVAAVRNSTCNVKKGGIPLLRYSMFHRVFGVKGFQVDNPSEGPLEYIIVITKLG